MLTKIEVQIAKLNPGELSSWITPDNDGAFSVAIRAWSEGPWGNDHVTTTSLEELGTFIRNAARKHTLS